MAVLQRVEAGVGFIPVGFLGGFGGGVYRVNAENPLTTSNFFPGGVQKSERSGFVVPPSGGLRDCGRRRPPQGGARNFTASIFAAGVI
jgi:hypothetical protein